MWPQVICRWQGLAGDTLRHPHPLPRPPEEFSDLAADRHESRNLAGDPAYQEQIEEPR